MEKKVRIVCDLPLSISEKIDVECSKLGLTRASYFRMVILTALEDDGKSLCSYKESLRTSFKKG